MEIKLNGKNLKLLTSQMSITELETLCEIAGVGLININVSSGEILLNNALTKLAGYEPGELPHSVNTKMMLTCEEDQPLMETHLQRLITGEADYYHAEYRMIRKDSSLVWISEHMAVAQRDKTGKIVRLIGLSSDMSREKWLEEQNVLLEEDNRKIALNSPHAQLEDQNRMLRAANRSARMIVGGFNQDYEKVLKNALQILGESILADRVQIWRNCVRDDKLFTFHRVEWTRIAPSRFAGTDERIDYADLFPKWTEYRLKPTSEWDVLLENAVSTNYKDETLGSLMILPLFLNGEFWGTIEFDFLNEGRTHTADEREIMSAGALVIASSISRNEAFGKLNADREDALESSKAKGDFLSRMSHEIRTPMNAVIGMTELALRARDEEQRKDHLLKVKDASTQLLQLLNDILDMSKIEADKLELENAPFNFEKMVERIGSIMNVRMGEKVQHYETAMNGLPSRLLIGDELRLSQVIMNLIGNANKFTPDGGTITLQVDNTPVDDNHSCLRVAVIDTGIGVAEDQMDSLFDSFEQADGSISRRFGGSGLGLSICKRLIEMMDGKIWIESTPGEGSSFIFEIPVAWGSPLVDEQEETTKSKDRTYHWQNKLVLIAEDIKINQEIIAHLLAETGASFDVAENGKEALAYIESAKTLPDLVLMDIQMPEMDGLEATTLIRQLPGADKDSLPIVAMTANAFNEDVRRSLVAGMNAHLSKPLEINKFFSTLADYLD
ncbi:PAS domain S-box-containing protein [Lachnospiraceae bacterium PM6-15]|uniref:hybrid sensor histidine kinase/response regulator n=1 Tax=Ohessyouella blattaphilus TaxID=2949333 RepID=UPI003E1C8C1B